MSALYPAALVVGSVWLVYWVVRGMSSKPEAVKKPTPPRNVVREWCETGVFVVALVLLLKLFAVEAFVIPTGSMAETLYGYQKNVVCPECGYAYTVNSSYETDPPDGVPRFVVRATCPNCRHTVRWDRSKRPDPAPGNTSGDRVLVHKGMFHWDGGPTRGDVVVFKYPVDPQVQHTAQNYIKRLWGLGGETIAIWRGDLYLAKDLQYPPDSADQFPPKHPRPADPLKLWEGPNVTGSQQVKPRAYDRAGNDYTYHNAELALAAFEAARKHGFPAGGGFVPLRKTDAQALAMRRIVYDADHPSPKLAKAGVPNRWQPDAGWVAAGWKDAGTMFAHSGELSFMRYTHRVPATGGWESAGEELQPSLITNFLGYNAGVDVAPGGFEMPRQRVGDHYVGDLMLEGTADMHADATVVLEVSRGADRFRASFEKGQVTVSKSGRDLASRPSGFTGGKHRLRFANFDSRLRVWVDGSAIDFGTDADYQPGQDAGDAVAAACGGAFAGQPDGHTVMTDIAAPACVGASGAVSVNQLKLWQDTFFTPSSGSDDPVDTFYVQPGHYLCLGDNSGQSSDGRTWGLVPERLMLGKACVVFFPVDRIGFIR